MNHREEINKMLESITQEPVLKFICSFIRIITSDPESVSIIEFLTQLFGTE